MLDNMFLKFKDCVGYVYIWKKLLKVVLLWFDFVSSCMNIIGILRKCGEIFIRYKFIFMCMEVEWLIYLLLDFF